MLNESEAFLTFAATAPKHITKRVIFSSNTALRDLLYIMTKGTMLAKSGHAGNKTEVPATEKETSEKMKLMWERSRFKKPVDPFLPTPPVNITSRYDEHWYRATTNVMRSNTCLNW